MSLQLSPQGYFRESSWIAAVMVVDLLIQLTPCNGHLTGVSHNDEVPSIQVRAVYRLMFASQHVSNTRGKASQILALRVHQPPFPLDLI